MKKLKLNKKPIIALITLLTIGVVGVVYALFGSNNSFINPFSTATYDVQIEEVFEGKFGKKEVNFVNRGNTPVVIRVSYNEIWSLQDDDDFLLTLSNKINGKEVVDKKWTNEWLSDFILGPDGWYYYSKILNADSSVQVLESINLNLSVLANSPDYEKYFNYDYELDFNFEALQGDEKAIKDIWKYEVNINNDEVSWPFA